MLRIPSSTGVKRVRLILKTGSHCFLSCLCSRSMEQEQRKRTSPCVPEVSLLPQASPYNSSQPPSCRLQKDRAGGCPLRPPVQAGLPGTGLLLTFSGRVFPKESQEVAGLPQFCSPQRERSSITFSLAEVTGPPGHRGLSGISHTPWQRETWGETGCLDSLTLCFASFPPCRAEASGFLQNRSPILTLLTI